MVSGFDLEIPRFRLHFIHLIPFYLEFFATMVLQSNHQHSSGLTECSKSTSSAQKFHWVNSDISLRTWTQKKHDHYYCKEYFTFKLNKRKKQLKNINDDCSMHNEHGTLHNSGTGSSNEHQEAGNNEKGRKGKNRGRQKKETESEKERERNWKER